MLVEPIKRKLDRRKLKSISTWSLRKGTNASSRLKSKLTNLKTRSPRKSKKQPRFVDPICSQRCTPLLFAAKLVQSRPLHLLLPSKLMSAHQNRETLHPQSRKDLKEYASKRSRWTRLLKNLLEHTSKDARSRPKSTARPRSTPSRVSKSKSIVKPWSETTPGLQSRLTGS